MYNKHNQFHEEAEQHIKGLELEIEKMRQKLSSRSDNASDADIPSGNGEDVVDIFTEWRKSKKNAEEAPPLSSKPATNIRRSYEPGQQDAEDLSRYLRKENRSQGKKTVKPIWAVLAFVAVFAIAALGIGKWADMPASAQQDEPLTVIDTIVSAEKTAAGTVAVESSSASVEPTTVAAEQTTSVAEIIQVGAAHSGEETKPNTSMVAIGKRLIYIDPGHGGNDHGCVYGGVSEKDVDLEISMLLGAALEDMGYEVVYTSEHDEYFSLSKRSKFANESKADIFVSVHCNAYEDTSVYGLDVYYNKVDTADALAEQVFNSLSDKLDTRARSFTYGSYQVLRQSKMPGILLELGFLSNDAEREKLCDAEYQEQAADAIAEAIHEYFVAQEADEDEE